MSKESIKYLIELKEEEISSLREKIDNIRSSASKELSDNKLSDATSELDKANRSLRKTRIRYARDEAIARVTNQIARAKLEITLLRARLKTEK